MHLQLYPFFLLLATFLHGALGQSASKSTWAYFLGAWGTIDKAAWTHNGVHGEYILYQVDKTTSPPQVQDLVPLLMMKRTGFHNYYYTIDDADACRRAESGWEYMTFGDAPGNPRGYFVFSQCKEGTFGLTQMSKNGTTDAAVRDYLYVKEEDIAHAEQQGYQVDIRNAFWILYNSAAIPTGYNWNAFYKFYHLCSTEGSDICRYREIFCNTNTSASLCRR
jgi:hypothetical protein